MRTLLIFAMMLLPLAPLSAQQPAPTEWDKWLAKPVSISGVQTVESLTKEIARQTGIGTILPNELKARKLTVSFHNAALRNVLDALSELYGWIWKQEEGGGIRLEQAPVTEVTQLSDLPQALNRVLPVDLRGLLMIEMPLKDGLPPEIVARPDYANPDIPEIAKRRNALSQRILPRMKSHYDALTLLLGQEPMEVAYSKMTDTQKEHVLAYFMLSALRYLPPNVLYDLFEIYQRDFNNAVIELQNGRLMIGSYTPLEGGRSYTGFGKELPKEQKP